jgi:hypothetical protein
MILVRFKQKVSPWNIGETAGFADSKAHELNARGVVEFVDNAVETVETVIEQAPVDRMIRRGRPPRNF